MHEYILGDLDIKKALQDTSTQIQSLSIGSKYILVGTKTGDIYELPLLDQMRKASNAKSNKILKPRPILTCQDNEIIKSIAFSPSSEQLYSITMKGLFSVWELSTLGRVYSKNFQRNSVTMISFMTKNQILIAFENEIICLLPQLEYTFDSQFHLKFKSTITDMKMTKNENLLAVSLAPNNDQTIKIIIYATNQTDQKPVFEISDIPTKIDYLDFSTDNQLLLYKDELEEIVVIDLSVMKKTNTIYVDFETEWCGDGLKIHVNTQGIQAYYTDENQFTKMVKLGQKTVFVTDEIGTIRIFPYPYESANTKGYFRCYTHHLNYISQAQLSDDKRWFATFSDMDRQLLLWRVNKIGDPAQPKQLANKQSQQLSSEKKVSMDGSQIKRFGSKEDSVKKVQSVWKSQHQLKQP